MCRPTLLILLALCAGASLAWLPDARPQAEERARAARALKQVVTEAFNRGDFAAAQTACEQRLALWEALGDRRETAEAGFDLAVILFQRREFRSAREQYQRSLSLFEALADLNRQARCLRDIGLAYQREGDLSAAAAAFRRSLALYEALEKPSAVADLWDQIGACHHELVENERALEAFRSALKLRERLGDEKALRQCKGNIASVLANLARVRQAQGDYALALDPLQESLALYQALHRPEGLGDARNMLGISYLRLGRFSDAAAALHASRLAFEEAGRPGELANVEVNLGLLCHAQGLDEQALEHARQAQTLAKAAGLPRIAASAANNAGMVYWERRDYPRALESFRSAHADAVDLGDLRLQAVSLLNLGQVSLAQGQLDDAMDRYLESLHVSEAHGLRSIAALALLDCGWTRARQGRTAEARDYWERSQQLADATGLAEVRISARVALGRLARKLGQLPAAKKSAGEAISLVETLRGSVAGGEEQQQRFLERWFSPYPLMVEILVDEGEPARALEVAERSRARVLLDVLSGGRALVDQALTPAERRREEQLRSQLSSVNLSLLQENQQSAPAASRLATLKEQVRKAQLDLELFRTAIYAAHPELRGRRGETPPFDLPAAGALIPDAHTALLEFVVAKERTLLFLLTRAPGAAPAAPALQVYSIPVTAEALAQKVNRLRQQIASRSIRYGAAASELYDLLLRPAAAALRGRTTLGLLPDGPLWELPFQALQSAPGRFLVEDTALFYASSLTVLQAARNRPQRAAPSGLLLAFGNPAVTPATAPGGSLAPLPSAEAEVDALARIYGSGASLVCKGAAATETLARARVAEYRVLHFAAHGVLNDRHPLYSHLVLAREPATPGEDGLLEARELMDLDLKADLAVLSACESGRGRVAPGEGMVGLSWALHVAGCPRTIVSQWKVDSASTTRLMIQLHRNLRAGGATGATPAKGGTAQPYAEALRQAALAVMRERPYRHPFYWAPFVLLGPGR